MTNIKNNTRATQFPTGGFHGGDQHESLPAGGFHFEIA